MPRLDGRTPLSVTVTYRGGAECWYEIRARGRVYRRPGVTAIHDVMSDINAGIYGVPVGSTPPRRRKRRT